MRGRLETHGGSPSKLKDAVMKASGPGFVLFAKSQPDTPGKLATHAYSYEHLELASYELLLRVARRAGDGAWTPWAASPASSRMPACASARSIGVRSSRATPTRRAS